MMSSMAGATSDFYESGNADKNKDQNSNNNSSNELDTLRPCFSEMEDTSSSPFPTVLHEEEMYGYRDEDFSTQHHRNHQTPFQRYVHYVYAVSRLLVVDVIFDWTSADNGSLSSKLIRLCLSISSYSILYTTLTAQVLWGIAYLMNHGWYLLGASGSGALLLVSCLALTSYEWMWRWQERLVVPILKKVVPNGCLGFSHTVAEYEALEGGNRITRTVTVHDDDGMEDDLSVLGWLKRFTRIFMISLTWLLYCVAILKIDFWITNHYMMARPNRFRFELQLLNCLEAAPILWGAAVLMYFAYPPFYQWHAPSTMREGVIARVHVDDLDRNTSPNVAE